MSKYIPVPMNYFRDSEVGLATVFSRLVILQCNNRSLNRKRRETPIRLIVRLGKRPKNRAVGARIVYLIVDEQTSARREVVAVENEVERMGFV